MPGRAKRTEEKHFRDLVTIATTARYSGFLII